MLAIHLLGTLRLEYNGQPRRFAALPKTLPLWAYLLVNRAKPTPRSLLAYTLWPDMGEEEARGNLRRHLYELRRVLPPAPDESPWVLADAFTVQWNPAADAWLDIQAFEELCGEPTRFVQAVELYKGDLLPELYDDWVFFERERLRTLFYDTLIKLIGQERERGDYGAAIDHASLLLRRDPLREDVVRALMMLRVQNGDTTGALLDYRRFEQRLRDELDVAPTVETSALYDSIARQLLTSTTAAPAHESAPVPELSSVIERDAPLTNLPAQLTSFIGRETELAALRSLLGRREGGVRLLTLTGAGGSGKSRLAMEFGARLAAEESSLFPHGIFMAPLVTVSDSAETAAAIVKSLNIKEQPGEPPTATLQHWLKGKSLLLILDNFEHVMDAASFVTELLAAAPTLRILVTSRTLLHVYGEHEFIVSPLPVPDVEDYGDPEALTRFAAVNLFLTRSRAVKPTFVLNRDNAPAIAELCVRLDGLPLALELAAARSKIFSPQAMLGHLRDRLTFFADLRLPERQRTLRATLDWSYQLLSLEEQRLFARLAVFVGRFSLEAAEEVCAFDGDLDVLDTLTGLVSHSLVQQLEPGADETIYLQMLGIVHQYALELISPGDETRLRSQHAAYYARLTKRAYPDFSGAAQTKWTERFSFEDENLSAALEWSLRTNATPLQVESGAIIAQSMQRYWQIRGRLREGYGWYLRAIGQMDALTPEFQVYLCNLAGSFAAMQGELAIAQRHHQRALEVAHPLGNAKLEATTLHFFGLTVARSGDLERGNQLLSECLALYRRTPEITSADLGSLLNNLAIVATRLGDFARSMELLHEGLSLCRARGDKISMGHVLSSLGDLARLQGKLGDSARFHHESLVVRQELDNRLGMVASIQQIADLALAQQNPQAALRLYAAAHQLRQEYNSPLTGHQLEENEANLARLRNLLDAYTFDQSWRIGANMSLEEATRLALAVT